jgi:uncharacterized Zn-binding protein involved in type VI secretion
MPPVLRHLDPFVCTMSSPQGFPHVGGVVNTMTRTVRVESQLAACVGDLCICATGEPGSVRTGSRTVIAEIAYLAYGGSIAGHGGYAMSGQKSVYVGVNEMPSLGEASRESMPFARRR